MSEYMIYKHNINPVVISVSGLKQPFEVGHKPPYYKYEDIIFSSGIVFDKSRKMFAEELPKSEYDKHLAFMSSGYKTLPLPV